MIGIRLELRIAAPSNPKIAVLIRFGEFCIQNGGRFSEGAAALNDITVQKIKTLIRLRGTASASYGQGREFEPRFVPHRTIFEKDTFTARGKSMPEYASPINGPQRYP